MKVCKVTSMVLNLKVCYLKLTSKCKMKLLNRCLHFTQFKFKICLIYILPLVKRQWKVLYTEVNLDSSIVIRILSLHLNICTPLLFRRWKSYEPSWIIHWNIHVNICDWISQLDPHSTVGMYRSKVTFCKVVITSLL